MLEVLFMLVGDAENFLVDIPAYSVKSESAEIGVELTFYGTFWDKVAGRVTRL